MKRLSRRRVLLALAAAALPVGRSALAAPVRLLVLGDSLAAGYGLARADGFQDQLLGALRAKGRDVAIVDGAVSGDTTAGGKARLEWALADGADAAIVELGGNDGLRGLSLQATEDNLRAIIAASQKIKATALLVGMKIPPNYGRDYTQKFSGLYPKLAKETKSPVVPFLLEGMLDKPQLFQADRIHPTAEAQPILLDNVWPHLKPLLTQ